MRLTSQEEYGLRCLLQLAVLPPASSKTIQQIADNENLSQPYAAKLLRILKNSKLIKSVRGHQGGYRLAFPPENITVGQVLEILGGHFSGDALCDRFTGQGSSCAHLAHNCTLKYFWKNITLSLEEVFFATSLSDLLNQTAPTLMVQNKRVPSLLKTC